MRTQLSMMKAHEEEEQKEKYRRVQARLTAELMKVERLEREQAKVNIASGGSGGAGQEAALAAASIAAASTEQGVSDWGWRHGLLGELGRKRLVGSTRGRLGLHSAVLPGAVRGVEGEGKGKGKARIAFGCTASRNTLEVAIPGHLKEQVIAEAMREERKKNPMLGITSNQPVWRERSATWMEEDTKQAGRQGQVDAKGGSAVQISPIR